MTGLEWFNIITGIAGLFGAASWVPIVMDKMKKRELRASLVHCRFFGKFRFPVLPPDYASGHYNSPDIKFDTYEGTLIVLGFNICSANKDFVVESVKATLTMDKSEHEAILVSPDVIVPCYSTQDNTLEARLYIPSQMDISKMKNIRANVNTRLYMALICKDVNDIKYSNFSKLRIELIDIDEKSFVIDLDKNKVDASSLIIDRDIYDVDYAAKIGNRKLIEMISNSPNFVQDMMNFNNSMVGKSSSRENNEKQT